MANDVGIGLGGSVSNTAVAVGGTVLLALIAGHVVTRLAHPGPSHWRGHHRHWRHHHRPWHHGLNHHHIMHHIYEECVHRCSHPHTVHKNRDRIYHAMHQRMPHIKELLRKAKTGHHTPHKMAEGVQNLSSDILIQFDIPQHPHPSAANPRLVQAFENQRHNDITYRYTTPGQMVLDPYERNILDREVMSYAGEREHGEHGDFEHGRHGFEAGRLRHYFGERFFREQFRMERALAGLYPPWLLGNIAPVGPYYEPYPVLPAYGPDLLHPGLFPGGGLIGPIIPHGFPHRFR